MNKKLLFLAGLAPLVAAPALVVASCSTSDSTNNGGTTGDVAEKLPSESQPDVNKALKNIDLLFKGHAATFSLYKPSQFGPVKKSSKAAAATPVTPKAYLPKLDPRQNFGFKTEYESVEDKDDDGTKKIKVTLTRGKETKTQEYTIKGFLTTTAENNEKDDKLNPTKVLNGFKRSEDGKLPVPVNVLLKAKLEGKTLDDYLKKGPQEIIDEVKEQILVKSGSSKDDKASTLVAAENSKPLQWEIFGIKENAIGLHIQIQEAKASSTKDKADVAPKKSGIYLLKVELGDNVSLEDANFEAAAYGFNTLNTPIKGVEKADYLDQKASDIKSTDDLMQQLDKDLLSQVLDASDISLVENSANDDEGSLRIKVKLGFKGKTPKLMEIKLYGFKLAETSSN